MVTTTTALSGTFSSTVIYMPKKKDTRIRLINITAIILGIFFTFYNFAFTCPVSATWKVCNFI